MSANSIVQQSLWNFIASQESERLSLDPLDSGNWTSGKIGLGELKGSKFGISAATFPTTDISAVTSDQAMAICMTHYWPAIQGDTLVACGSPALAMVMTDAAWISGPHPATQTLQKTLGMNVVDGIFGQQTKAAVKRALAAKPLWSLSSGECCLITDLLAERVVFESTLAGWSHEASGWVHRMTRLGALAQRFILAPN